MFPATAYTEAFEREQGLTDREWRAVLPRAVGGWPLRLSAPHDGGGGEATITLEAGQLRLRWTTRPPRAIALMRMPVLAVAYRFSGVGAAERVAFMRQFDLVMQRGGG